MPSNEESGEFELVLGNKQLLSVFVIVIILLGVFFAMGYAVGRSSAPVETATRHPEPEYVRGDAPSAMGSRAEKTPEAASGTPAATAPAESEAPAPAPSETPAAASAPAATKRAAEAPAPAPVHKTAVSEPAAGQIFLQVAAVGKPEADVVVQVLRKKGFAARVAAGPSEQVFRVLVGPIHETGEISKVKAELEQAGFKSFVKKY